MKNHWTTVKIGVAFNVLQLLLKYLDYNLEQMKE